MHDVMDLLHKVERGEISAEEASRLLDETRPDISWTENADNSIPDEGEDTPSAPPENQSAHVDDRKLPGDDDIREYRKFTRWWMLPFGLGIALTILGTVWMYLGVRDGRLMPAFWLAWLPFIPGVVLMAVSWKARASHWVHLNIRSASGGQNKNLRVSFPLPIGLLKWVRRTFKNQFPKEVRGINLDDMLDCIKTSVTVDNPVYIWLDDDEEREQIEIWVGRTVE